MTQKTRPVLQAQADTDFPDNNQELITEAKLREYIKDINDSHFNKLSDTVLTQLLDDLSPQLFAALDGNSKAIQNILDPVSPQDAATKAYVDALSGSGHIYNALRVVDLNGDDNTAAVGDFNLPYDTLEGAVSVASSGDTILMIGGTYSVNGNPFKAGITIVCLGKVILNMTGSGSFDDLSGGGAIRIMGDFEINGNGSDHLFNFSDASTSLTATISKATNAGARVFNLIGIDDSHVSCDFISSSNDRAVFADGTNLILRWVDADCSSAGSSFCFIRNSIFKAYEGTVVSDGICFQHNENTSSGLGSDIEIIGVKGYSTGSFQACQFADDSDTDGVTSVLVRNCYFEGSRSDRGAVHIIGGFNSLPNNLFVFDNSTLRNSATGTNAGALSYGTSRQRGGYFRNNSRMIIEAGSTYAFYNQGGQNPSVINTEGETRHNAAGALAAVTVDVETLGDFVPDPNMKTIN